MSESTPPSSGTSLSLLERVRTNDPESWRRFVVLYSPLVYYWCQRAGLTREDAADMVQIVWQAVSQNIGKFQRQGGTFRGWLWTITRNRLHDHYRKRRAEAPAAGGSEARQHLQEIPENEPESYVEESAAEGSGNVVQRALELVQPDFEPHNWRAFWLTAVENHTAREAAVQLGMSLDAVYQAKARVLRRLREELAELHEFDAAGVPESNAAST